MVERHGRGGLWRRVASVDVLDHLADIVLHGCHGGDYGRRAEAVRDEREVRKMALERGVEYWDGTHGVVRGSVLTQHVRQLLQHLSASSHADTHAHTR